MKSVTSFFFLLSTLCVLQHVALVASNQLGAPGGTNTAKPASRGATGGNLIEEACQHATHKELCITTLKNNPNSQGSDLTGLAYITIRLAAANAADVESHLRTLVINNASSLEPAVQQGVSDCIEHYSDANEQLDDSTAALSAKAFKDVELWVNVAIGDADYCENSLQGQNTVVSEKNQAFKQLCENVLAVIKALAQKG